jgi:hypothetical protein
MIYKFRILSDENDKFLMDIEIRDDQTFYELHEAIQNEAEWDNSQLASFYTVNDRWEKQKEITLLDMSEGKNPDILVMDEVKLSSLVKKAKQKLLYVYDFFSDRAFFLELVEILERSSHRSLPYCTFLKGDFPPQIKIGGKNKKSLFAGSFDDIHDDDQSDARRLAVPDEDDDDFGGESHFGGGEKDDDELEDDDHLKDGGGGFDDEISDKFSGSGRYDDDE